MIANDGGKLRPYAKLSELKTGSLVQFHGQDLPYCLERDKFYTVTEENGDLYVCCKHAKHTLSAHKDWSGENGDLLIGVYHVKEDEVPYDYR